MGNFYSIWRKELRAYFISPIAYVVIVVFLIIFGYFFFRIFLSFDTFSRNPFLARMPLNVTDVMRGVFMNTTIFLLFMTPLLSMRLLAEETKSGTAELLFTYPVRDSEVILGKFGACLALLVIMLLLTLPCPLLLAAFSEPEAGPLFAGYLGLFLMGASFIALGVFTSSLTENQIIAAVLGIGILLLLWVLGWAQDLGPQWFGGFLGYLSLIRHAENLTKGMIDTADVTYYLTFIFFCLFLTLRSLESKKWRGKV